MFTGLPQPLAAVHGTAIPCDCTKHFPPEHAWLDVLVVRDMSPDRSKECLDMYAILESRPKCQEDQKGDDLKKMRRV